MTRPRYSLGLRKNFLWTLSGNLIFGLCQWGMIAVIAKLSNPEAVGQFALGLAITAPVYMFTNLQLRAVQATDAAENYRFSDYLGMRLTASAVGFASILVFVLLREGPGSPRGQIILWLAAAKAFEAISDVLFGLAQREERMDQVAISLIARGLLSLVVLGSTLKATGSLIAASAALAILWLLLLVTLDWTICRRVFRATVQPGFAATIRPTFVRSTLLSILFLGAPLGIARLLMSLQTSIPRFVIDHFSGERALGIFAALTYLIVIGNRFMHSLGQSMAPRLARYHVASDGTSFRLLYLRMIAVGLGCGLVGIVIAWIAGPWILAALYGPEYAAYNHVFVWVMVAAGIGYVRIFMDYAMIATRWIRIQVPLLLMATLVLAACSFYWVPRLGILGGAVALVVAAAVHLSLSLVVSTMILRTSRT